MRLWQDRLWKQSFCRKPHAFLQRVFKVKRKASGSDYYGYCNELQQHTKLVVPATFNTTIFSRGLRSN